MVVFKDHIVHVIVCQDVNPFFDFGAEQNYDLLDTQIVEIIECEDIQSIQQDPYNEFVYFTLQSTKLGRVSFGDVFDDKISVIECISISDT